MLELLLPAARFLHYAAAMQLFGIAVFAAALAPPGMPEQLSGRVRGLAIACVGILVATSLIWLGVTTAAMGNGWADAVNPATLQLVLTGTQFGRTWLTVLVLDLLLVAVVAARPRWWALALLSGAMLAVLGLVGHLAATGGWTGGVGRASQIAHLAAAGFWLGSLLPLALSIRLGADAEVALRRFSGLGHLAVAVTLATGLVNTWLLIGGPPTDLASPWQALLAAKIGLVLLMVGLALANRYVLLPRFARDGAVPLYRSALAEMAIGGVVVALVSVLGTLPMG
ncbi:MAG: copper homeostasis membrane protein CopD [Devosia sp.]|uniref:copper homeostasis membrane protein CopD n=1 Tax=Devosia sp. TaxID=1871048 RepID=UPI001A534B4D|nr:copper homeostasis membrane protein CopD [Devosia sp.]MBL8596525.1 copper homeostasis membrane protein CopD [Devosia sp.]